jgi:signal transduction histidine kinase
MTATGDPRLLSVALTNLLDNAWKFTGKILSPSIQFSSRVTDGQEVYSVQDNGAGFNPEFADKLFAPFQRLHRASDFDGTGVGLAIVQRVIQRHNGRVWAESAVDQGATFYFTLKGSGNR